ncbi:hypothetical protein [Novacetimonas hansenii]|nr:hypothetical protein [Novacetimonas hansenii]
MQRYPQRDARPAVRCAAQCASGMRRHGLAPAHRTWYRHVPTRHERRHPIDHPIATKGHPHMNATEIRTRFAAALDNILSDDEVPADARILPQALSQALVEYRLSAAQPEQDLTPADITVSDITEIDRLKGGDDATAATLRRITDGQDARALRLAFLYYCQAITRMAA